MTNLSSLNPYYRTDNATASAADVATGKTAYVNGGKVTGTGVYSPAMMEFDGSTGYYSKTQATSGNKVTLVARFNLIENPSGTGAQYVVRSSGNTTDSRAAIILSDGNHATPAVRNTINFLAWNSAGAIICRLFSTEGVNMADTLVTVFASFDGDTGTGVMRVNGVSEDATHSSRVAPTTGTMDTGSATQSVGANWDGSLSSNGNIGFVGMHDAYLTNWQDFMAADGTPKEIDEIGWKQWGGQPLFWNKGGLMTDNAGSAGAMTKNGTITGPSGGWPLFWNEHGQGSNNQGSAGDMTENGLIVVGNGGN